MSAYLCNPQHIGALAAFAVGNGGNTCSAIYEWRDNAAGEHMTHTDMATLIAFELAACNVQSVSARYPNDKPGERPGPCGYDSDEDYYNDCARWARTYLARPVGLKPLDYLKMLGCYEYQSCEHEGWKRSLARKQVEWLEDKALRCMPGWDDAVRDFDGTLPRKAA